MSKSSKVKRKPRHGISEGNIFSVGRLPSTSSSTSNQSLSNCCHYVSVVVTNEQAAMNSDNNITCHTNVSKQFAVESINDIFCPEEDSQISGKVDNSIELTDKYSNCMDVPSDVINLSGNHDAVHTPKVIIKYNKNSDTDYIKTVDDMVSKTSDAGNLSAVEDDDVAFTDETCNQYIDSEESVTNEEVKGEDQDSLSRSNSFVNETNNKKQEN